MKNQIQSAQIIVPCRDLKEALDFFVERLGFRVKMIFPADSPASAVISQYGLTLHLQTSDQIAPLTLRMYSDENPLPDDITGPNGIRIEFVETNPPIILPKRRREFVISRSGQDDWTVGRAGMQYRDLIPGRLGGRFIASHIRIPNGGKVPDYVHYHRIIFQIIYCKEGFSTLVYEDQGEPFIFKAGDCILQPPEIRHRVLEASDGFEVIEVGCPAVHETFADHDLKLPTRDHFPDRFFGGQKFAHHVSESAVWTRSIFDGFLECETGISEASGGVGEVKILRTQAGAEITQRHSGEFLFYFVLRGECDLESREFGKYSIAANESMVIPSDAEYVLRAGKEVELLEVFLPELD